MRNGRGKRCDEERTRHTSRVGDHKYKHTPDMYGFSRFNDGDLNPVTRSAARLGFLDAKSVRIGDGGVP